MVIGIDAMGGDNAPSEVVEGIVEAQTAIQEGDIITLIGNEPLIREHLDGYTYSEDKINIVHAPEVIAMDDQPTRAFSAKPRSSISVGFRLLKEGKLDTFASAGNTGAMLVGSVYEIGVIKGLIRPTTAALVPKENSGYSVLLDVGTNPDVKPDVMNQFAFLGSLFAEFFLRTQNPKVGLLNIGSEDKKGNILCQSTFPLLKQNDEINFIGNVEGHDIFNGKADVIVCDGYTGNIVLKQLEAFYEVMAKRQADDPFIERLNFENHGATPVIGINKPVLIAHGISKAKAFKNMVVNSAHLARSGLNEIIRQKLAENIGL